MARLRHGLAASAILAIKAAAAATALQLRWTTDNYNTCAAGENCGSLGPDGPWQALVIDVGDVGNASQVALYPIFSYGSSVVTKSAGGKYDPSESRTANLTGYDGLSDAWRGDSFLAEEVNGTNYNDFFGLNILDTVVPVNTTFKAVESLSVKLPNGSAYTNKIGNFGLAAADTATFPADNVGAPGVLDQLKADTQISSRSWSLQMGSAALNLAGSLILGGYDKSRTTGAVGTFLGGDGLTYVWLVDLELGMEEGGSTFDKSLNIKEHAPKSVWQGVGRSPEGINLTKTLGGKEGSAAMLFSPVVPYIYLPMGNCEAIANYLPVSWRDDIKYYVWNVQDPLYHSIVSSSAYLAFAFADAENRSITIKLPFSLLNLTLDSPIVTEPTQYFPCQSSNTTYGYWELGRAFLQGAFVSFNYDTNVSYFSQAPGPDPAQSVIQTIDGDNAKLASGPDTFADTWRSRWTVYPFDDGSNGAAPGSPVHVSIGYIAGIVVGGGAIFAIVVAGVVFFWKRRSKRRREDKSKDSESEESHEVDGQEVLEAPGGEMRHELVVPEVYHEAPVDEIAHELPADRPRQRNEKS